MMCAHLFADRQDWSAGHSGIAHLDRDDLLYSACLQHNDDDLLSVLQPLQNIGGHLLVLICGFALRYDVGQVEVVLGGPRVVQKQADNTTLLRVQYLELSALHERDVEVVGSRAQILVLLAGEDVECDNVRLCMAVLTSLGSRHLDTLARAPLDHKVRTFPDLPGLLRVRVRRAGLGRLEGRPIIICHCSRSRRKTSPSTSPKPRPKRSSAK